MADFVTVHATGQDFPKVAPKQGRADTRLLSSPEYVATPDFELAPH